MASSLAVIPWNQPDANKVVAKIDENSRPEGGRWGLVLHTLLNPSPGRTLDEVYQSLGEAAEKQANRVAYKLGLGPHVVANKIRAYFGDSEERVQRLELLRSLVPAKLERRCSKLMKYTQPTEYFCHVGGKHSIRPSQSLLTPCPSNPNSSEPSSDLRALCIRYLGGILDLPGFWSEMSYTHAHVASKLCSAMVRVFKDIGVDVLTLGPLDESEPPFDYEGVDFLSKTVLTGISNWLSQLDREQLSTQPWYDTFSQLVHLLRMPRAAELLPASSTCATTTLDSILSTVYRDTKLNVTVNSVHTKTSDQDAQDVESNDEDHEDGSSEVSSENEAHVSPASEESYDSDTQMLIMARTMFKIFMNLSLSGISVKVQTSMEAQTLQIQGQS
ncbi:hypothetical protein B0H19DRAFT_1085852 [Mycena capillaripes]|nr:hypothetical protein B0H19DRAFT_1085852 [Mycena capillaripes]